MSGSQASPKETQFYHKLRKTVTIWAGGEKSRANRYAIADTMVGGPIWRQLVATAQSFIPG